MAQASLLIEVVRKSLRERGLTYALVAKGLGLSESSVKRVFSQENLSLDRLDQICALMDLEIADLFDLTRAAERRMFSYSVRPSNTLGTCVLTPMPSRAIS